jgi:hypothetical protein
MLYTTCLIVYTDNEFLHVLCFLHFLMWGFYNYTHPAENAVSPRVSSVTASQQPNL